jgi:hypothetical protein
MLLLLCEETNLKLSTTFKSSIDQILFQKIYFPQIKQNSGQIWHFWRKNKSEVAIFG